jgi:hypothetical protein
MSIRFTDTGKWDDGWFSQLTVNSKILFLFLCDSCSCAGFIEINKKVWAAFVGLTEKEINSSLGELNDKIIYSKNNECIFIRNFLKHQKNLPLNENNKAHLAIIKNFDNYKYKFNTDTIDDLITRGIEGGSKGAATPTGKGKGKGKGKEYIITQKNWRNDFEIYLNDLRKNYSEIIEDKEFIGKLEYLHPELDIKKTIECSCIKFWATEEGWFNKKKSKSLEINWKNTFMKTMSLNKIYKSKI